MKDENIEKLLRDHKLYATDTRVDIISFLHSQSRPLTARDISESLPAPKPDLATIHRTLNTFASHGIVSTFSVGNTRQYLFNGPERHEHVAVCLSCGISRPVDAHSESILHNEAELFCERHGFRVLCHSVVHYGFCTDCISNDLHACKGEE